MDVQSIYSHNQSSPMMHPEKATGPDGMTVLFFQHSWHIIKKDLVELVNNFMVSGEMNSWLNITNI